VNHQVDHVTTLSQAFQKIFQHRYDVILLDLSLSDSSGLDGLERLVELLNIPIVVLTGNNDPQLAEQVLARGAQDYIPKSEHIGALLSRAVRYAIQLHQSQFTLARTEGLLSVQYQLMKDNSTSGKDRPTVANTLASFAGLTNQCVAILNGNCNVV